MAIAYIVTAKKRFAIGQDFGISKRTVGSILETVYRVLDCEDRGQLGFLLGQHWEEISREKKCEYSF